MATVAITGSAGFIGSAFARFHADRGDTVRGLDRVPSPFTTTVADVTDGAAVAELVAGADLVIHTAALVAESGDWSVFHRLNAEAPRLVAEQARAAGVPRMVHLSSVMVHGFDFPEGCDESGPLDPADNPYCATKIRSEHLLADVREPGVFDVAVIRPGDVYGPGSIPWIVRPVQHMRTKTYLYIRGSVINYVYIDNLVEAVHVVLDRGDLTRPYIVTDGAAGAKQFWGRFAADAGMRWAPTLPGWLAEPVIGVAAGVLPTRVATKLDLDRQSIRYLRRRTAYSSAALRALGWQPTVDLEEGMRRTSAWLREQRLL